jgi:UDP-N-acetylmuramoylalanine--D-glutamate ligase
MDLKNKHVLVVGLGTSGMAMARFLRKQEALVTVADQRTEAFFGPEMAELRDLEVRLALGPHQPEVFLDCDLMVLSPGVPHTIESVRRAREKGIPVIGEIELAGRFIHIPILAVTGTNGKSTVTLLLAEMLRHCGFRCVAGGNLGTPLIELAGRQDENDFIVAEISSFQLDTIERFRPLVSVILNITDDHLDRYADFAAYARSKARIFENQGPADICVFNEADPAVLSVAETLKARRFAFNCREFNECRAWISENTICYHTPELGDQYVDCTGIPLVGRHNLENAAAAGLAVLGVGGAVAGIQSALAGFKGLAHRLEYVDTIAGVRFYDDSKATNVDAVVRALEAFDTPVVLLMGGRDKGGSYAALVRPIQRCVKEVIVLGEAADIIRAALGHCVKISKVKDMAEAVEKAAAVAVEGETVLLSPACSSFDMYESYARRGEDFVRRVKELKKQP